VHFGALPPLYFDLTEDPHELVDRAGDARYHDAVLAQAQRLLSWEQATRDDVLASLLVTPDGLRRLGRRR
jgi:hypothetical protein